MRIRKSIFAEDGEGNEVLITPGDVLSEIEDAGPRLEATIVVDDHVSPISTSGWNVTFRTTPKHKLWTEIVTCDAVKLLKAMEGRE